MPQQYHFLYGIALYRIKSYGIVWYCMVLHGIVLYHCWLRRAGCVSQDTYLLYLSKKWDRQDLEAPPGQLGGVLWGCVALGGPEAR